MDSVQKISLIVLSAIFTSVVFEQFIFWAGWICMVPFIICLKNQSPRIAFRYGFLFGIIVSSNIFFWMIQGASSYSGGNMMIGISAFILSSLVFTVFIALVVWLINKMNTTTSFHSATIKSAIVFSAMWMLMEVTRIFVLEGFPFLGFQTGYSIAGNLYAIQPVSIAGYGILTLVVLFVNYLFAEYVNQRQWKKIFIPFSTIFLYMIAGYFILVLNENKFQNDKKFKIALVTHNIPPEVTWNKYNENELAKIYIDLNKAAVKLNPDLIVWTESAIPWRYTSSDPLMNILTSETNKRNIQTLIGVNRSVAGDSKTIYDSALLLNPDGSSSVYDKHRLLTLLEEPIGGKNSNLILPFVNEDGIKIIPGPNHQPLPTIAGKAGIMICNESMLPAYDLANKGATYLLTIGNDGWFNQSYLMDQHFYCSRLRAVETRKDIIINTNLGYVGMIESSGEIIFKSRSKNPEVNSAQITANSDLTLATKFPNWLTFSGIIVIIILKIFK